MVPRATPTKCDDELRRLLHAPVQFQVDWPLSREIVRCCVLGERVGGDHDIGKTSSARGLRIHGHLRVARGLGRVLHGAELRLEYVDRGNARRRLRELLGRQIAEQLHFRDVTVVGLYSGANSEAAKLTGRLDAILCALSLFGLVVGPFAAAASLRQGLD